MKTPRLDVDSLIEALRDDLPGEREEARVRARLLAAGVVAATGVLSSSAAANSTAGAGALGSAGGASTAPLVAVQAGLWSKVIALPLATKIGVATTVAIGVVAGSVPALHVTGPAASNAPLVAATDRAPLAKPDSRWAAAGSPPRALDSLPTALPKPATTPPLAPARIARASAPETASPSAATSTTATSTTATSTTATSTTATSTTATSTTATSTTAAPRTAASSSTASSTPAPEPAPPEPAPSPLAEETALMEQAITALQRGNPERARYWLGEHARRFPDGLLARERHRALARAERMAR